MNIVSFSGGKDSTAMLLMMLEKGMRVDEIVCFDTGWEFPQMVEHWYQVEKYIGMKITILKPERPFNYWLYEHRVILKKNKERYKKYEGDVVYGWGWPNFMRRWCTGFKKGALIKGRRNENHYIGIAVDEKRRVEEKENNFYPLVEWGVTEKEALEYCRKRGFMFGGLYERFHRVSCFCCPLQRVGELRNLYLHHNDLFCLMKKWDEKVFDGWEVFKNGKRLLEWEQRFNQERGLFI
jgi:3'-phosphoadenosine 5'-phosphosulfate sulfotransferase (PAPS reductase)/FAD synthetase